VSDNLAFRVAESSILFLHLQYAQADHEIARRGPHSQPEFQGMDAGRELEMGLFALVVAAVVDNAGFRQTASAWK
jgi:hypothetical protein